MKTREPPRPKKRYATPRFVRYGDVRLLTKSGSLAGTESATMMMRKP